MAIPRFNARIGQIQVPSMKNYQEEQNASIAKSLADFGSALLGGAIELDAYRRRSEKKEIEETLKERSILKHNKADTTDVDKRLAALGVIV